jgi:Arc/MetJ-type ribon-helix-helix transcriptional regulator
MSKQDLDMQSSGGNSNRIHDFTTVRVPWDLSDGIEEFIKDIKEYGVRKYVTKSDFVRAACLRLMEEEEVRRKTRDDDDVD